MSRLLRPDFASQEAYHIYETQLLYWETDDLNFCITKAVSKLAGLPADAESVEEGSVNGFFVYLDGTLVEDDL